MTNDKIQMTNKSSMTNDKSKGQNKEIRFNKNMPEFPVWKHGDVYLLGF